MNRTFYKLGAALILGITVGLLVKDWIWADPPPGAATDYDTARVRRLEMTDADGKKRITLGMDGTSPNLNFLNGDNKIRLQLGIEGGLPMVSFTDKNETTRAAFGLFGDTADPAVQFFDDKAKGRLQFCLYKGKFPTLNLMDSNEKVKAQLAIDNNGEPGLIFFDLLGNGRFRAALANSVPYLDLTDDKDTIRAELTGAADLPHLRFYDSLKNTAIAIDHIPSLAIADTAGHRAVMDSTGVH